MNRHLQGGCQLPIGAFAIHQGDQLWLRGLVGQLDGKQILQAEVRGPATEGEAMGIQLAQHLLSQGADQILAAVYQTAE